jgi:hypothetical protein
LEKGFQQAWLKWSLLNRCERRELLKMLCHQPPMKLVSPLEENSWKSRKLENGTKEKKISKDFKMKDSIFFNQPSSKEKRKLKKSTLKELKKLDLEKPSTKKELLLKFKERELRFSERCIKQERTSKLKEKEEISSKIMLTLDLLFMLLLQEMVFHWTKKPINMRFNRKLCHLIRESKN